MSKILEKINTDRILSVTAILIGLMTLVVYFVQTRLIFEQQHAGVWPCIEITGTNYGDTLKQAFKVNITNKGIGPAIIKKVEIQYKGETYREFSEVFYKAIGNRNYGRSRLEGRTMASNEEINPIDIPLSKEGRRYTQIYYNKDSMQVKIYYQSVYGKCFVSSGFDVEELPDCSELEEKN
jgi:hypothetical protein